MSVLACFYFVDCFFIGCDGFLLDKFFLKPSMENSYFYWTWQFLYVGHYTVWNMAIFIENVGHEYRWSGDVRWSGEGDCGSVEAAIGGVVPRRWRLFFPCPWQIYSIDQQFFSIYLWQTIFYIFMVNLIYFLSW